MGDLKNILITGANGFLGSHLLDRLIKMGYRPIAYLRPGSDIWRIKHLQNKYITYIAAENSKVEIEELFKNNPIEAIFHTATDYGRNASLSDIIKTNVLFPLTLIETGEKHLLKLFVNTDTFFGKKQFDLKYLNGYTTSKRIFEGLLPGLALKVNIVNLRLEHVYGENDAESKFVTTVLKQLIQNTNEILLTEGMQKRDFIYIEDAINAYISILQNADELNGFNEFEVGTGQSIPVREFVLKMAELTMSRSALKFGAVPTRDGEIQNSFANIEQLRQLGWNTQYNLDTAITKILESEKKRYTNEN